MKLPKHTVGWWATSPEFNVAQSRFFDHVRAGHGVAVEDLDDVRVGLATGTFRHGHVSHDFLFNDMIILKAVILNWGAANF